MPTIKSSEAGRSGDPDFIEMEIAVRVLLRERLTE